jgi:hypothetical protein
MVPGNTNLSYLWCLEIPTYPAGLKVPLLWMSLNILDVEYDVIYNTVTPTS